MHPRIPLAFLAARAHCWLMVNLSSTRTPRSLSAELLSSRSVPACTGAWGCSSPGAGPCPCPCWTSWGSSVPNSPACPGLAEWQHSLLVYLPHLPVLCSQQTERLGDWGQQLRWGRRCWVWPAGEQAGPFVRATGCPSALWRATAAWPFQTEGVWFCLVLITSKTSRFGCGSRDAEGVRETLSVQHPRRWRHVAASHRPVCGRSGWSRPPRKSVCVSPRSCWVNSSRPLYLQEDERDCSGGLTARGEMRGVVKPPERLRIWPLAGRKEIGARLNPALHLTSKPLPAAGRGSGWGCLGTSGSAVAAPSLGKGQRPGSPLTAKRLIRCLVGFGGDPRPGFSGSVCW